MAMTAGAADNALSNYRGTDDTKQNQTVSSSVDRNSQKDLSHNGAQLNNPLPYQALSVCNRGDSEGVQGDVVENFSRCQGKRVNTNIPYKQKTVTSQFRKNRTSSRRRNKLDIKV